MRRAPLRRTHAAAQRSRTGPADRRCDARRCGPGPWRKPERRGDERAARAVRRLRGAAREDRRRRLRRVPADQGHHARAPRAALARRLRSPRLRRAAVLAAPPRLRHRPARPAPAPRAALAGRDRARRQPPRADRRGPAARARAPLTRTRHSPGGPASRHATHLACKRFRQPRITTRADIAHAVTHLGPLSAQRQLEPRAPDRRGPPTGRGRRRGVGCETGPHVVARTVAVDVRRPAGLQPGAARL